jgi:hypothetical protein
MWRMSSAGKVESAILSGSMMLCMWLVIKCCCVFAKYFEDKKTQSRVTRDYLFPSKPPIGAGFRS